MLRAHQPGLSRPPRARGLKRVADLLTQNPSYVAPPAGAWIETLALNNNNFYLNGRAPRGRVD